MRTTTVGLLILAFSSVACHESNEDDDQPPQELRIHGSEFACMSVAQYFFTDAERASLSWEKVRILSQKMHLTASDFATDDVRAIVILAAKRDRRILPLLRRAVADIPESELGSAGPLLVWSLMWVQDVGATEDMLSLIRKPGYSPFALSALERLYLRSTKSERDDFDACHKEWVTYVSEHSVESSEARLEALLSEKGIQISHNSEGALDIACLTRAWGKFPLPRCCLDYPNLKEQPSVEMLISMRVSELLCASTEKCHISPVAFPYGVPDRQWLSHFDRVESKAWQLRESISEDL